MEQIPPKDRKFFWLWWLLPFPLLNLILLVGNLCVLVTDVQSLLIAFKIIPSTATSFPSQSQIAAYGFGSYKSLILTDVGFIIVSLLLWFFGTKIMWHVDKKLDKAGNNSFIFKPAIVMSILSGLSLLLLIIAYGFIG